MAYRKDPTGEEPARKVYLGDTKSALDIISRDIRGGWRNTRAEEDDWVAMPEVLGSDEIMKPKSSSEAETEENWDEYKEDPVYDPKLPRNIIDGPWPSRKAYLEAHFRLNREDAAAPLRAAVARVQQQPNMDDDRETHIYTQVYMVGTLLSRSGPAIRIEFSTDRAGKRIRWDQSSRLMQGSIVALSPAADKFTSICKIAVVAARPFQGGLDQNPPTIDLFWENMEDLHLDSTKEWIMVEARQGFYEANRHVLLGLQKASTEKSPLSKNVVGMSKKMTPPPYIKANPTLDLTPLEIPKKVNVLTDFPEDIINGMDKSQLIGCKSMLTQQLAIIQGPPGTGKTFVSVAGLKVLIHNLGPSDPPIIVAAQTNHALDQLLNHILQFEKKVVRIGGRCDKKNKEIVERTLFELREANWETSELRAGMNGCFREYKNIYKEIKMILDPLKKGGIFGAETLREFGILTEKHIQSLKNARIGQMVDEDDSDESEDEVSRPDVEGEGEIREWLGEDQLVEAVRTQPANLGLPMEEIDLEFEQLKALEEEAAALRDNAEIEALSGEWIPFGLRHTVQHKENTSIRQTIKTLSSVNDLYKIPRNMRGRLYQGIEKVFIEVLHLKLKPLLKKYQKVVEDFQVVKASSAKQNALNNFKLVSMLDTKIVGCTTTGLAKYRPLLAALKPRTLLIEEAAETLEATVTAGMIESLEQLILVGDHKQLQASCNVPELEEAPYHLSISMFERLVNNNLPFTMLNTQRRMISDVRMLLTVEPEPFYKCLKDHPSVLDREYNRKHVPGMGERDVYFFQHEWPEAVNSDLSRYNQSEAQMIAGFFNHLVLNGTEASKITVLTFYNGQRKEILNQLKRHERLRKHHDYFNVVTVDSYQGEENDIILLSLVRSNFEAKIGFLSTKNRLVVALSRARRGLYLFGNAVTLSLKEKANDEDMGRDPLWRPILKYMAQTYKLDMENGLPITCTNHGKTINLFDPSDWSMLAGGCFEECGGVFSCGHRCVLRCHPFEHEIVQCRSPCNMILDCGHGCSNECGELCLCMACDPAYALGESDPGELRSEDTQEDEQAGTWMTREQGINQDLPIRGRADNMVSAQRQAGVSSGFPLQNHGIKGASPRDVHSQISTFHSVPQTFDDEENVRCSGSEETTSHLSSPTRHHGGKTKGGHGRQQGASVRLQPEPPVMVRDQLPSNSKQALKAWNNFDAKTEDARMSKLGERESRFKTNQSVGVVRDNYTGISVDDSGRVKNHSKREPVLSVAYNDPSNQKSSVQSEEKLIDI